MIPLPKEASIDTIVFMANKNATEGNYPDSIIRQKFIAACEHYNIKEDRMCGKDRSGLIVTIRKIVCYHLRFHYKQRLVAIGNYLNKDHSTVIHYCEVYENHANVKDPYFIHVYDQLKTAVII